MKPFNYRGALATLAVIGLSLAQSVTLVRGDEIINQFDTADEATAWTATWGSAPKLEFDSTDAGGSAESGSLKVTADYLTPANDGWEQSVITRSFTTPIIGADQTAVSVTIKVDPSSAKTLDGNYGYFELKRTDGTAIGGVNLTNTEWTTITFPIAPTEKTLSGIIIQNGNAGFQGPVIYYLDNFVFIGKTGETPPPTLAIAKSTAPGLKLYASAPGQAYQRQNIVYAPSEHLENNLWWVNQGDPISYSITWADFPNKDQYSGFQGHIMLVRDSGKSNTPDWNDANVVMIEFQYANGEARARFLHKVKEPAGNAMLYRTQDNAASGPVGVLGEVTSPSMLGTWTLTFKNDTDVMLTAPGGKKLDLTIPAEEASLYEPASAGISAIFGVQPNSDSRVGLSAVISEIKITKGETVVIDETFPTADLDPAVWIVRSQDNAGVFPVTPEISYIVSWNLPDEGFSLNAAKTLKGPWSPTADPVQVGARRLVLVDKNGLPATETGYFRLVAP